MKVLVCGGRDFKDFESVNEELTWLAGEHPLEIIHGGAGDGASYAPRTLLDRVQASLLAVDEAAIAQRPGFQPAQIQAARLQAVENFLQKEKS